jgi:transposase
MLIRLHNGEKKVWSVVHVPSVDDEDCRQLHRELIELKAEQSGLANRTKGLLVGSGLAAAVNSQLPVWLGKRRQGDKSDLRPALKARILREFERWRSVGQQIGELEAQRRREIRTDKSPQGEQTRRLIKLKGIGASGAWLLVGEFFGWRKIRNRRELASLAGLTPTPYDSGNSRHEQGISKAGN